MGKEIKKKNDLLAALRLSKPAKTIFMKKKKKKILDDQKKSYRARGSD